MARRTKVDADATRQALLDAAERVFYERGVARASLAEIAQAAGATRGGNYWHFNAMMDRITLPLEVACGIDAPVSTEDPLGRVRGMVQQLLEVMVNDPHTRRELEIAMYRVEYVSELSGVRERHLAALQRFHAQLARDLEQAARQTPLVLPMTAADAALGLQALFDGLLQAWILGRAGFDLCAVGGDAVDAYLRGLGFAV